MFGAEEVSDSIPDLIPFITLSPRIAPMASVRGDRLDGAGPPPVK